MRLDVGVQILQIGVAAMLKLELRSPLFWNR
jgi:hypothetical protein